MPHYHIVVADDDLDDQELIRSALLECNFNIHVEQVTDGVQLMDYLLKKYDYKKAITPDLILLDLNMPLMDGYETLAAIDKHEHLRKIPLYVVTTSVNEAQKKNWLAKGVRGFYNKGSSARRLSRIIREIYDLNEKSGEGSSHDTR